jgi:hypothetical protein
VSIDVSNTGVGHESLRRSGSYNVIAPKLCQLLRSVRLLRRRQPSNSMHETLKHATLDSLRNKLHYGLLGVFVHLYCIVVTPGSLQRMYNLIMYVLLKIYRQLPWHFTIFLHACIKARPLVEN